MITWRLVTDGMVKMLLLSPATSTWRDDLQAANGMTCYRSEKNTIVPTSYIEEFRGTAQHQNGEDDQQRQATFYPKYRPCHW